MASSSDSTSKRSKKRACGNCGEDLGKRANWSGVNIFALVLGFVFFWPIGLFILYWILTGRDVEDLPGMIRQQWQKHRTGTESTQGESDNQVFNEFQQTQFDRIRELKEEIKARSQRFGEFRNAAKRRADEDEFQAFMSDTPAAESS